MSEMEYKNEIKRINAWLCPGKLNLLGDMVMMEGSMPGTLKLELEEGPDVMVDAGHDQGRLTSMFG